MILRRVKDDSEMSDFLLEEEFRKATKDLLRREYNIPLDRELEVAMSKEMTIGSDSKKSLKDTLFTELNI